MHTEQTSFHLNPLNPSKSKIISIQCPIDAVQWSSDVLQSRFDVLQWSSDVLQIRFDVLQWSRDVLQNARDVLQWSRDVLQNTILFQKITLTKIKHAF